MREKYFRFLLIVLLFFSASVNSQEVFNVHLTTSSITAVPAVHSGAFAIRNGKWIFLGGRIDGLHTFQSNMSFPTSHRNDSIYLVDPVANTYKAVSATLLPVYTYGALCSANMQFYQDGRYLYMIGGYGSEDSSQSWITFPSLISVDLDSLISKIDSSLPISNCFRQLVDTNLAVAGGALDKIDSTYYLIFGHRFDGRYAHPPSGLFTQRYTHEIRKFTISDNGMNLSIGNYSVTIDTNDFHRRDFNLAPQIYPNQDTGFTVFGGVFQKNSDRPFLTPIDIASNGIQHQSSFNQNLNQYTTALLPVYDSLNNFMHTLFFGGMSLFTLDTATMSLIQDTLVPFVSTISKVSRDGAGNLTESKMSENMPSLLGSNAMFIPDTMMMGRYEGRILDLNSISGNTRVGFIAGGIHSDFPNIASLDPVGMSRPNAQLYEVYIDKTINTVSELNLDNSINDLLVFPNPFNEKLNVNFTIKNESMCEINLFDRSGKNIKTLLPEKKLKGEQKFTFIINDLPKGVYLCQVRAGKSLKAVKLVH
jgi:hypothetical protein